MNIYLLQIINMLKGYSLKDYARDFWTQLSWDKDYFDAAWVFIFHFYVVVTVFTEQCDLSGI